MFNIKRLLAATDFSPRAARAETRAAMLCAQLQCEAFELLTVNDVRLVDVLARMLDSQPETAQAGLTGRALQQLQETAARITQQHGVRCSTSVRCGRCAPEIIARAEAMAADVTVVGAHGGNFLDEIFLGNTADKLLRIGTRPLLIVRQEPQHAYRQVLVAVDFSADSERAAQLALRIAPEAHVTFLHAFHVWFEGKMRQSGALPEVINAYRVQHAEQARHDLNRFIDALGTSGRLLSRSIQFGHPAPVISNHVKAVQPDLLVMGKHGGSHYAELLLGSITRRTIDQTGCDVLIATAADDSQALPDRSAA